MRVTDSLFKGKIAVLQKFAFTEYPPLASTNLLIRPNRPPKEDQCIGEIKSLFECIKAHEFDDLPCSHIHDALMRCVHEGKEKAARNKAITRDAPIGEKLEGKNSLTVGQLNKLMKQFPQPDLGMPPYHYMRRLPTQQYYADIFNLKKWKGRKS